MKSLHFFTFFLAISLVAVLPPESVAQNQDYEYWAGAEYDNSIPSPADFLGYELGDWLTDHHRMEDYIMRLQELAPDRLKVIKAGYSQERRPIYLVVISSAENMQVLDEHRERVGQLKDPDNTNRSQAEAIAETAPVISWNNYANDGDESAAFEAALQVSYHFAAGTDAETMEILDNTIIVINTAHNPDSHQNAITWMKAAKANKNGTADPIAHEHRSDWLMSNSNSHYQIDMNRDAFALTQQETQIVAENLRKWNPQVWVDYHGEPEEYFFAPYAIPVNPNYPSTTEKWADVFGQNNGAAFDRNGWTYYAREIFDLYYPGYWDSYPAFYGAIGMTYETNGGGEKGFRYRKEDGTLSTLKNAIRHHVVASISTIKTASDNRRGLLLDYYDFFRTGMEEVEDETVKQVALLEGEHPNDTEDLVSLLLEHDIEVYQTDERQTADGIDYLNGDRSRVTLPTGTYIVPMAQPNKRLAKVLLERDVAIPQEFLNQANAAYRYNKSVGENAPKKSLGFYDVTSWSLPMTYGVETYGLTDEAAGNWSLVEERPDGEGTVTKEDASYAYLFSYSSNDAAEMLSRLVMDGYNAGISTEPFTIDGRTYKRGTVVLRVERNPEELHLRIRELAAETGTNVEAVNSAWTTSGILLGSRNVVNLQKPNIAVLMEEPTHDRSYGAIWFTLEQRFGIPFTPLRVDDFNRADLYKYDVLVLPPGSASGYERMLGKQGIEKLKNWISNGGTFVGIKDGAVFAADEDVQLTTSKLLEDTPITPGSTFRLKLDTEHYLSLGYGEKLPVHVFSNNIFTPSEKGANVGLFDNNPLLSGFVFEDNRDSFAGNAWLVHEPVGRGNVVLFAEQPIFRLYWRGPERLFLNSLLFPGSF